MQSFELEKDSYVCTYGGIIRFQYAGPGIHNTKLFINMPKIHILLIDSKSRQNKREQMNRLARMIHYFPQRINAILDIIDFLSKRACDTLIKIKNLRTSFELETLYQELGVSFWTPLCIFFK